MEKSNKWMLNVRGVPTFQAYVVEKSGPKLSDKSIKQSITARIMLENVWFSVSEVTLNFDSDEYTNCDGIVLYVTIYNCS